MSASASEDEMDESPRKVEHAKATDPERIWLSPCCDPERTWCQDAVFEVCECGAGPVAYLRADLAAPAVAAASADPAADLALLIADLRCLAKLHMETYPIESSHYNRSADAIARLLRERDGLTAYLHERRAQCDILRAERDAALRERDEARAEYEKERVFGYQTASKLMDALQERNDLMRRLNKENAP